jgi:hypothetical protein
MILSSAKEESEMNDQQKKINESYAQCSEVFARRHEITKELDSLQGKKDEEANEREAELLEELMTIDMALQPFRKTMGNAAGKGQKGDTEDTAR